MPRDVSGNYTLPAGINPVVADTLIDVNWANPTLNDIASQLNNVVTRDGLLGPVGPFKLQDGTVTVPGLAFNAEPSTGLFRESAGVMGVTVQGVKVGQWSATGLTVVSSTVLNTFASYIGIEIGWRSQPRVDLGNATFNSDVRGKTARITANMTIPSGVFNDGDVFYVQNASASDVRLLAGAGMTVHEGGTLATNNIALQPWGSARVWFISPTECVVSGNTSS